MTLSAGTRLGPYEILAALGAGGMGEVYRARDTRLGREVALKVLPAAFASDNERLHRFERESRAASALSDPHIVSVFDVGEDRGVPYFVAELIEGTDLRQLLERGPLPLRKVLDLGGQIAAGLASAHEKGIVHRDLKPENILVSNSGFVKIADFGLAKLTQPDSVEVSQFPTLDRAVTEAGVVMGTVAYMSPEQAKGQEIDARSDQFAFGSLLYELLTGYQPFRRDSVAETISAIIRDEPEPVAHRNSGVPLPVQGIVERCQAKDPAERYGSTRDLARDLQNAHDRLAVSKAISKRPREGQPSVRGGRPFALAGIFAAAVFLLFVTWWFAGRSPIDSVAVLPFENASGNPDTQYLSDGITEALINDLSKLPGLTVISRSAAFRFRDKDPTTAGRQLGVRAVLTGRVVERGNSLSVSAELVEVQKNRQIWGERFERKRTDLLELQEQISAESRKALELDPLSPSVVSHLAVHYVYARQFDQAIAQARKAIELDPNFWNAHRYLGWAFEQKAMYPEAISELVLVAKLNQNNAESLGSLGHAYAASGDAASARRLLGELKEPTRHAYVSPYSIALIYLGLGQKDEAFALLKRALDEHIGISHDLELAPRLDPVRGDPRFRDLLRQAGLP